MAAKRILVGSWFDLPRLGTETFAALVRREGVVYDKSMGFKFDAATDLPAAVRTLRSAGVEVEVTLRCWICGKEACEGCPYLAGCDRTRVSTYCLCGDHAPDKEVYDQYAETFGKNLEAS
ncbi:MAG TPA: hypothetical protein VLX56_00820 [Nitrososphaerales archaeon]|nr:hypothetical protein [Nitrososphaerales archaeon]